MNGMGPPLSYAPRIVLEKRFLVGTRWMAWNTSPFSKHAEGPIPRGSTDTCSWAWRSHSTHGHNSSRRSRLACPDISTLPANIQFFPITQMGIFFLSQVTLDALVGSRIVRFLGGLCESVYIDLVV
ncbi:hypothetical protein AFLA_000575 [Aspergillus flavus NRRL3357]|nr:hypothetical protein AFLA_000575 [Aspergillus flavus NRRL3357]